YFQLISELDHERNDFTYVAKERSNTILFNSSKNEVYKLNDSYKNLHRKLKGNWKVLICEMHVWLHSGKGGLARIASQSAYQIVASVFDTMWKGSVSIETLAGWLAS
ncbi:unnamed protein product, partial [Timema podura]|nr:unnamed protein product [Timema podura]